MGTRPICYQCTRSARTVDTPNVKVRVEWSLVFREGEGLFLLARCHGAREQIPLMGHGWTEDEIEGLEVFRG